MDETLDQTPPLDSLKPSPSGATLEMGKPKSGTLGVSGKTNLGPDQTSQLLANMQAELDRRNSPMNSFLGGLQRASAWGSGGVNGPSAALTAMDREEMLRGQETRAMQEKMLAIQANQAAKERFLSSVGYGQPGAATAQPGAAPAAQAGQMPAAQAKQLPEYLEVISRLPLNYRGAAMRAIEGADQEAWNAIIAAAEKNRTPEDRNLELIERTPAGPKRDMLMNQVFKDAMANKTAITPQGEIPYTPEYTPLPANLRPRANVPGTNAPLSSGGVNLKQIAIDAGIPANAIISDYRDPTKQLGLIDREDPNNPGKFLTKEGKPVALPGRSAHQIPGAAIDIKPSYPITPAQEKALLLAGARKVPGDKGHYELPVSSMAAQLAVNEGEGNIGQFSTQSKQGQELAIAGIKGDNESIIKEIQNPMLAKVAAEKDLPPQITRTLDILDKTKTGPGASTAQLTTEIKGFFKELKPDELQQLINQKTVSQTQATLIASGIKAAFGAQLSDKEGDRYVKTLFTIDDPKQFIRASLELKRAAVYSNKDFANFLLGKSDKAKAIREYESISEQRNDEILKKHAPTVWSQMQKASNEKPAATSATQPGNSRAAAELWLKNNPNDPDAPAVRKKLGL